jgi:hypothetical protein
LQIFLHVILYQKWPQRTKDPAPSIRIDRLNLWEGAWVILRRAESRFGLMSLFSGRKSLITHYFLTEIFARYFVPEMTTADQRSGPVYQNQSFWPMGRLLSHSAKCCVSFRSDVAPHRPKIAHFSLLLADIFEGYFVPEMTTVDQRSGPVYQNQSSWPMGRLLSHSAMWWVLFRIDVALFRPKIAHYSLLLADTFARYFVPEMTTADRGAKEPAPIVYMRFRMNCIYLFVFIIFFGRGSSVGES